MRVCRPLNEGRSVNPGDTRRSPAGSPRRAALNEGRSVNPGDTSMIEPKVVHVTDAQRRPERQPRRHLGLTATPIAPWMRSTKAGASTPATRRLVNPPGVLDRRSTKAGASTPATPDGVRPDGRCGRRSTKAGASTPATPLAPADLDELTIDAQRRPERQPRRHLRTRPSAAPRSPLNEGRSVNPGDTVAPDAH